MHKRQNITLTMLLMLLAALLLAGCAEQTKDAVQTEKRDPKPYCKEFETGPLKAKLSLDRTCLRLDEDILMTLDVYAPEGYQVQLPKLEEGLKMFQWELVGSTAPALEDGGVMHYQRSLRLGAIVIPDKMTIQPMLVKFSQAAENGGERKQYEISTDEVELEVTMPPAEFWEHLTVDCSASVTPKTQLEKSTLPKWAWYAIPAILLLLALLCWLIFRRKKSVVLPPPPPPHLVAMEALRRLVEEKLVENGNTMEFYNRIQGILRTYIEARFNIHAPERTTQEFLRELQSLPGRLEANSDLPDISAPKFRSLLERFLSHCDLVRFACHAPEQDEIQATFNACRDFIMATGAQN